MRKNIFKKFMILSLVATTLVTVPVNNLKAEKMSDKKVEVVPYAPVKQIEYFREEIEIDRPDDHDYDKQPGSKWVIKYNKYGHRYEGYLNLNKYEKRNGKWYAIYDGYLELSK